MTGQEIARLEEMALRVRERVVRAATGGGCFIGSALSCADVLTYLYARFLDVDRNSLDDPERDRLFLSKGHAVPVLYSTLVEVGILEHDRLEHHLEIQDCVYWHPNRNIPGIEFHSGSLGHGLPVAVGVAMDGRLRGQAGRVVVIVGDGELNEGSNWEACLVASAYRLDNLIIVVDRNGLQANLHTEDLSLQPLESKFEGFGCAVIGVNGHDFAELDGAFGRVPLAVGRPSVVIADTVRGKGLSSIEGRADRWFCDFSEREVGRLVEELQCK